MDKQNLTPGITTYQHEGKNYFSVFVQARDKTGRNRRLGTRFSINKNRISDLKTAKKTKQKLQIRLSNTIENLSIYTWEQWQKKALSDMRKFGLKESSLNNYEKILNKWLPEQWFKKELNSFVRDDVFDFIHTYLDNRLVTEWSKYNIYRIIRRFFSMAVEYGEINQNPATGIKVNVTPSEGKVLNATEIKTLLKKAKVVQHEYYPHWVLALMTGMRCGELYALNWSNINFEEGLIHVSEQFTSKDGLHLPKKGKIRPVDLSPELGSFLLKIKRTFGMASEKLWSWEYESHLVEEKKNGRRTGNKVYEKVKVKNFFLTDNLVLPRITSWSKGTQAKELRKFCAQIGIKEIKFHDLRASHITNLLSNGVAISKVMKQVGHSKMSTTDGYHRFTGVAVKGVTDSLSFGVPKAEKKHGDIIDLFKQRESI